MRHAKPTQSVSEVWVSLFVVSRNHRQEHLSQEGQEATFRWILAIRAEEAVSGRHPPRR